MSTIDYYNTHAQRFVDDTVDVDMSALYAPFLALLPPGGHILDAGCGSGRDSLYFRRLGYQVTAFDASQEMVTLASALLGESVMCLTFQSLQFDEHFDGVWACASLLHVPQREMDDVLCRLTRALKPGGILYASFKLGEGEQLRDGRLFTSFTEASFRQVLARHPALVLHSSQVTADVRPGRTDEQWLNLLLRRQGDI